MGDFSHSLSGRLGCLLWPEVALSVLPGMVALLEAVEDAPAVSSTGPVSDSPDMMRRVGVSGGCRFC